MANNLLNNQFMTQFIYKFKERYSGYNLYSEINKNKIEIKEKKRGLNQFIEEMEIIGFNFKCQSNENDFSTYFLIGDYEGEKELTNIDIEKIKEEKIPKYRYKYDLDIIFTKSLNDLGEIENNRIIIKKI
jgi:hypothetical protein